MHLDRIFTTCPYLIGSPDGVICQVADMLVRNIEDINPDNCISRHFELCHLYISKLQEVDIISAINNTGTPEYF
jgi:hypothetical protein